MCSDCVIYYTDSIKSAAPAKLDTKKIEEFRPQTATMTRFTLLSTIVSVALSLSSPSTIHTTLAAHTTDKGINTNNGKNNSEGDFDEKTNTNNGDYAPSNNNAVLCSSELNAYCPSNTKCCPRYGSNQQRHFLSDSQSSVDVIVGYSCLVNWSSRFPIGAC